MLQLLDPLNDNCTAEPRSVSTREETLDTTNLIWIIQNWDLQFPDFDSILLVSENIKSKISDILRWTDWSSIQLGDVLLSNNSIVEAILNGNPVAKYHIDEIKDSISDAHKVIERIYELAKKDSKETQRILNSSVRSQPSVIEHLKSGQPSKAYLAALDLLNQRTAGLIVGNYIRQQDAVAPLHD
jgi:hypothetical protein